MSIQAWRTGLACAVLYAATLSASAAEVELAKGEPLQAHQARVEREFASGGRFAEIEAEQRARVRALFRDMGRLVNQDGLAHGLAPAAEVELFNLQEELNSILDRAADDSRLVCRRERHVGSNRPVNTCATVAERRRLREGGQEMFRSMRPAEASIAGSR